MTRTEKRNANDKLLAEKLLLAAEKYNETLAAVKAAGLNTSTFHRPINVEKYWSVYRTFKTGKIVSIFERPKK